MEIAASSIPSYLLTCCSMEIAESSAMSPQFVDDKSALYLVKGGWHALDNNLFRINFMLETSNPAP